jgi:hypothetical protein
VRKGLAPVRSCCSSLELDPRQWGITASGSIGGCAAYGVGAVGHYLCRKRPRPGSSDDGDAHTGIDIHANFGAGFLPLLGEPDR